MVVRQIVFAVRTTAEIREEVAEEARRDLKNITAHILKEVNKNAMSVCSDIAFFIFFCKLQLKVSQ